MADGGETRFHSVKNGLNMIPDNAEGVVGVHDGVRPFPSIEVIRNCYETARTAKAVVPVIPIVETLIHLDGQGGSETVPRDCYRLVQTPQTFDIQLLKRAYTQPYQDSFYGRRFSRGQHRAEDNPYRREPRKHKNHYTVRPPHGAHSYLTEA